MKRTLELANPDAIYLAGRWTSPTGSERLSVIDPATEQEVASVGSASAQDVAQAVASAKDSFDSRVWQDTPVPERARKLRVIANELRARHEQLAAALTLEMGSPWSVSFNSTAGPPRVFDWYADLLEADVTVEKRERVNGEAWTALDPVGVVAAIVPWNAPLNLSVLKLAPALAAGCSVVLKPAPSTPLDAHLLAECVDAAGLPKGVVSILPGGNEAGEALITDPRVDKVTFTGSTATGRRIAHACADRIARVALELGGKSAAILLDDMSIEETVERLVPSATMQAGQACSALTRVLVHKSRHDALVEALAARMRAIRLGDPFDPETQMGPLAIERQRDRVEEYIAIGRQEGARVVTGGGRPAHLNRGFYVEPTLFDHVDNGMRIAREEIFGPVVCVIPYDNEEQAVAIANDSEYGLYASVFTHDDDAVWRLARKLRSGNVARNAVIVDRTLPYGGYKQSGLGREGGLEGLRSFQEQKVVYLS
ncbi:MAG: aldehyde dehydrogenase [Sphingomonas sp.]|nr:aldehyde dehydrogenase [Sphingomonas sp.]